MKATTVTRFLADLEATREFGKQLASELEPRSLLNQNTLAQPSLSQTSLNQSLVVYLHGELGAGKTSLVRSIIQGLDYQERVKSPTYTLVERYDLNALTVFHFDLYRLADPEELEFLGLRDCLESNALVFIEWPERGEGFLPTGDIDIKLAYQGDGRQIVCEGLTSNGNVMLKPLAI